ncbi:MAG: hypothetical protein II811_03465, partial [Spirochaetaceae bacterium]|nr:hypothetical protein [Spirochaetaceae bacterium]
NSFTKEGGFNGNNSMNSFNHFSLGAITEWIMSYQLGIMPSECGYKNFVLQPTIGGSFTNAGGSFSSPYGVITSEWKAKNGTITEYKMLVPANTSATLYLPLTAARAAKLKLPDGVSYIGQECHNGKECAQFAVEAGFYTLKL